MAMLINFSGFIVRASVDVSNTIAYEFYKKVSNDNHYFAIGMNFVKNSQAGSGIWGLIVKPVKWVTGNSDPASYDPPSEPGQYAVRVVGQAIFFVVLFLVFLIIGLLFIFRTVAIIGLFIFSPFGILSYAIPNASKKIAGWTDSLMKQLFFAPIMMFLLYAVMKIAEQGNDILTAINQQIDKMDTSYFTDMAYIVALNTAGQLLYFAIIAGLLIKSISWAKDMGAIGVDFAKKYASGALGLAAAGGIAIGKYGGKKALETNTGKNIASKFNSKFNNWYGGTSKTARLTRMIDRTPVGEKVRAFAKNPILGTAGGVNKFSAGLLGDGNFVDEKMIEQMSKIAETSKKSYEKQAEERIFGKDDAKFSDEEVLLNFLRAEESAQKHAYSKMNDKQRGLVEHLLNNSKDEGNRSRIVESIMKTRKMDTASIDLVTDETKKKALQDKAKETRDALIANLNSSLGTIDQIHEAEFRTEQRAGTEEAKEAVRKAPVIGLKAKIAILKNELTGKEKGEVRKAVISQENKIQSTESKGFVGKIIKGETTINPDNPLSDIAKIRNVNGDHIVELFENDDRKFLTSDIVKYLTAKQLATLAPILNKQQGSQIEQTLSAHETSLGGSGNHTDRDLAGSLKYIERHRELF